MILNLSSGITFYSQAFISLLVMSDTAISIRLTQIENELAEIKSLLVKTSNLEGSETLQLEGLLANITISDEDITLAKRSLFRVE